jgi:hypothetical protein
MTLNTSPTCDVTLCAELERAAARVHIERLREAGEAAFRGCHLSVAGDGSDRWSDAASLS